uniref:F-box/LRR-repeat protein n=1 Tax=Strongyloides papillosus TaxID=174720 RepID=A0A0N5BEZ2_STREA
MTFYSVQDENLGIIPHYYKVTVLLFVPVVDSLDIFDILNRSSQIGAHIRCLKISNLAEKDFESFIIFIEKFSSVEVLYIEHICSISTEIKNVYFLLSLSSLNNIRSFAISEFRETKILSADMIIKLIEKNSEIRSMYIGSWNIYFFESLFKKYLTIEQPCKMECKGD